jgi:4-hydroxybenzoate polyprenyltransferase
MGMECMVRSIKVQSVSFGQPDILRFIDMLQSEIVYGGHLTALGAPMKVLFVSILLNINVDLPILFIAYVATLCVYSVDYYRSIDKDMITNPHRASYYTKRAGIYPYLIASYVILLFVALALFANEGLIPLIALLTSLGFMYSVIFKRITKKVPGFKNVFTSGIWTSGVMFGLLLYYSYPVDMFFILVFLFLFFRSLGNVIFFDMKDIASDSAEGLKTIPVLLGKNNTVGLLQAMNVASFLPLVAGVCLQKIPVYILPIISLALFTFYNLSRANSTYTERHGYTYYILADVETIYWPVILLISKAVYFSL